MEHLAPGGSLLQDLRRGADWLAARLGHHAESYDIAPAARIANCVGTSSLCAIDHFLSSAGGNPCVRGTHIWVSLLLDFLASGSSMEEILGEYPQLTRDDLLAAIAYTPR